MTFYYIQISFSFWFNLVNFPNTEIHFSVSEIISFEASFIN